MSAPIAPPPGAATERRTPPAVDLEAEADLARCGALADYWYVACTSDELPARRPIGRTILGLPIVLFRDPEGRPAALFDRCLHRNARLSAGEVFDGRLGCPYHGWTYDAAGRCVEIPSLGPEQRAAGLDPEIRRDAGLSCAPAEVGRLRSYPCHEVDGLVFLLPGGDPARARREPFRTPKWNEPGWTSYYMVTRFPNGVTNLVENFMDVPHTAIVHRGWFRKPAQRRVPATVERRGGSVLVTYRQAMDQVDGLGRLFNPGGAPMLHTDRFIAPHVTRVDYAFGARSGFVITSQCTPVVALESIVTTAIAYRLPLDLPASLVARALRPLIRWYTRRVIRQDVEIMEIQRQGLAAAPGAGRFQGTEADLLHADVEAYRGWLRDGGEGAGPPDAERSIEFWI